MIARSSAKQFERMAGVVREFLCALAVVFLLSVPGQTGAAEVHSPMLHNSDNLGTAKGVWGVAGGRYGRFTCATCHANDATNIRRIRNTISAPLGIWSSSRTAAVSVAFMNISSYGSPGEHSSSTRICEVCHSKTTVHRYEQSATPHNGRVECTGCHQHRDGFKQPDCNSCHGAPPAIGKHAGHFAVGSAVYGRTDVLSSASAYGFSCGICHSGSHQDSGSNPRTVDVAFSGIAVQDPASGVAVYAPGTNFVDDPANGYTFIYSNGSCSSTYCHGNYPGSGKSAAPTWGDASGAACGSCHDADNNPAPASGSHARHSFSGQHGYFYKCSLCHKDTVSGDFLDGYSIIDKSKHANGVVNWQFDATDPRILPTAAYSVPPGTAVPSNGTTPRGYGTCSNIYCHSIGQTANGGPLTGQAGEYKETPKWGSAYGVNACGLCHDGGHGNSLASGSHSKHLAHGFGLGVGAYTNCTICHKWKATAVYGDCQQCHDNYLDTQYHVNGQVDVRFDPYWGNATAYIGTPTPGDGFGSCANTYCHSNGTGGTKNSGETRGIIANSSPVWGGTTLCGTCHGLPPVYASGSPKANSHGTHVVLKGIACKSCHLDTVAGATPDPTHHVNGIYDVIADGAAGASFIYNYAADGGSCDNVSCHGSGRKWGSYGNAVYLAFRSAAELNNTMEPMANAYLTTGSYQGTTSYGTTSASPGRRAMTPTFGAVEESVVQTASAAGNYRVAQFVSPRLAQAVTVASGSAFTITIRNKKSSALNTVKLRYSLYQWQANDSQGTNLRTIAQDSVNITTTATNRMINFTTDAGVTLAAGDRIVCEIEFTAGSGGTVTNSWGNSTSNYAGLSLPVTMNFLTEN